MTTSTHTAKIELPIVVGSHQGDTDVDYIDCEIAFDYTPGLVEPTITVTSAKQIGGTWSPDQSVITLIERAQWWSEDDSGFNELRAVAEAARRAA